mmetsp:Transcript_76374/g.205382  ORF Transcript_76374/g.205382 Transcript_76374/m.205382 type:complete len:222 (-) Transcript_76374:2030-2695(-)
MAPPSDRVPALVLRVPRGCSRPVKDSRAVPTAARGLIRWGAIPCAPPVPRARTAPAWLLPNAPTAPSDRSARGQAGIPRLPVAGVWSGPTPPLQGRTTRPCAFFAPLDHSVLDQERTRHPVALRVLRGRTVQTWLCRSAPCAPLEALDRWQGSPNAADATEDHSRQLQGRAILRCAQCARLGPSLPPRGSPHVLCALRGRTARTKAPHGAVIAMLGHSPRG